MTALPRLCTDRLTLTLPTADDAEAWLAFAVRNQEHLAPWSPPEPEGALTLHACEARITSAHLQFQAGSAVRFLLRERSEPAGGVITGFASLSQIVLGPFRACYLGYQLDVAKVGRGFMTESLRAVIRYAFDELLLHRIMANYMPSNERSGRVLRSLGFQVEGYARNYLFIAGGFQDHVLTSLTHPDLPDALALCTPGFARA
jgi:ribosomal-protein-alanine N-acetyltransferase